MNYKDKYNEWLAFADENTKAELERITDEKEIEDRFYKDLAFGTGGLRGIMGAGSNRMNRYTVGKATLGLARYLKSKNDGEISVQLHMILVIIHNTLQRLRQVYLLHRILRLIFIKWLCLFRFCHLQLII